MMASYTFTPVNWGGQQEGTSGTSHILNDSARQRPNNKMIAPRPQSPVRFVMSGPSFEDVSNFVSAVQSADPGVAGSLLVYGTSSAARAIATGQVARGRLR